MKLLKKTLKWLSISILVFLIIIIAGSYILYATADMKQPDLDLNSLREKPVYLSDSLRTYGNNSLLLNKQGLWELYVHGEPFERGVAIGKMSEDLLYHQEKVFVDEIRNIIPSDKYLKFLRYFLVIFNRNLGKHFPQENREEIYGISLSCTHEFDAIGTPYERQLNYHGAHDIGHMMQAYMLVGCSSFGTWSSQSADSSLIIGRNFDFYVGDDFAKNKIVAFYAPSEGYKFASVGWIGMTGVLSGMNETGLTITINSAQASIPTGSATPISILARIILQYASTIDEAYKIAQEHKTFVAESLLIGSAKEGKAAIIEKSPDKIDIFYSDTERIVCTNHYQSDIFKHDAKNIENIRTTDSDYRFKRINELLDRAKQIDPQYAVQILRDTLGINDKKIGLTNEKSINQFIGHHSVAFKPDELKMWVSTSPWQLGEYIAYDLKEIFASDTISFTRSNVKTDQIIAADNGLTSGTFSRVIEYKKLKDEIIHAIDSKQSISKDVLQNFIDSNAYYYYTYELLGDYYLSQGENGKATDYWQQALKLEMPRMSDKDNIERKIKNIRTK